jgi:hypothetical protein
MKITSDGIRFGAPLREFRGVLTGVPTYDGTRAEREQGFE